MKRKERETEMPPRKRSETPRKRTPKKPELETRPTISLDDLPKRIREMIVEKAGGDVTRIDIISHTEIIIRNPKD